MKKYTIEIHTKAGVITGPQYDSWIRAMQDAAEYCLEMEEEHRLNATFRTVVVETA